MRIKFNQFERVAGIFVMCTIVGGIGAAIGVAYKKGIFSSKVMYVTSFETADGIFPGTIVQISGLRAGSVDEVELQNDNKIRVTFSILSKFEHRIRQDSLAQFVRPFIIGDRVLDLQVGSENSPKLEPGGYIPSKEAVDIMSLLSGKRLGDVLELMSAMMNNLKTLAEAFVDPKRTESFIKTFDRIDPLVKNLNAMSVEVISLSKQLTHNDNIGEMVQYLAATTKEFNQMMPVMKEKAPTIYSEMSTLVKNLNVLTEEFKVIIPALKEIAPDLPHASRRAVEALDQAVVFLKATQKSFVLKGSAEEVKKEEMEAKKVDDAKKRIPANDPQ